MKNLPNIIISVIGLAFVCFFITSCLQRSAPGAVLYSAPPPRPTLQVRTLTEADITYMMQRGDMEYANGNFNAAKDYYYQVLLAVPNPSAYVLVSYGSSLANLGLCENAIEMFNRALEKDPYNETARKNISICRYNIGQEAESQRQFEQDQERIKRENLQNLGLAFNELSEKTQQNKQTQSLSAPLATMGKATQGYANMDSLNWALNQQNAFAILNLLGDVAQKNKSNKKLANSLNSLNKIAHDYQKAHNIVVNLNSSDDILNEQNMALVLASLGEMAQKNQDNRLTAALNNLGKIAKEYKGVQSTANEQNLIEILNSLNEIAQEYQNK
jgi:lipoprotein NlpI